MKKLILLLLFIPLVSFGQKFDTRVFPGFDKNASMVVKSKASESDLTGIIEAYLLLEGFDVRSEAVSSSTKKEISNEVVNSKDTNQDISISKTTYIQSEYVVEVNFSEKYVDFIWKIRSCNIKISNLSTGKIVALITKKSSNARSPNSVAEKAIESFMKAIK